MWYDIISACSDLVMAIAAIIALVYAIREYRIAKEQKENAQRQEEKQDELRAEQRERHDREKAEAKRRETFLDRKREIAHVEAFAVNNGGEHAIELSVPTEASIYEVKVWAQWPDEEFRRDCGINGSRYNRDDTRDGSPHVAPGRRNPWRMIRPGRWLVRTDPDSRFPWEHPVPLRNDDQDWVPEYVSDISKSKYRVVELEFTDCYGDKWRRCYGAVPDGAYASDVMLVAAGDEDMREFVVGE